MIKVLLIYPNQDYFAFTKLQRWKFPNIHPRLFPMINLGMLYLVSAIKDICKVEYIDNNIHKLSTRDLAKYIESRKPDIVGFGGTLTEWTQAKDVSMMLSEDIITIYGGPNATANPEKHVKYFDFVFRGWCEETLRQFIIAATKGSLIPDMADIAGLCWNRYIVKPALFGDEIRSTKYPARDLVDLNSYNRKQFNCSFPVDIVVASRGCPFDCKFCSSKSIWNRVYKKRSAEEVLWEVRYMKEVFGTKTVHFREDNLTVNETFLEELCKGLKELKIDWICQSRIDVLNKDLVRLMKDAGCRVICCGFESINDSTLEYINKGFTSEDVIKTIEMFEECGMFYSGGFMVGLLNEGEEEIKNTLEFVRKVSKYPHSFIPRGAGRFVCWPKSEIYNEVINNKELIAHNWQDGEQIIPHLYNLTAQQVENCITRYW